MEEGALENEDVIDVSWAISQPSISSREGERERERKKRRPLTGARFTPKIQEGSDLDLDLKIWIKVKIHTANLFTRAGE